MLGNGMMLKCNGSGNSREGSNHGGDGTTGNHAAIGGVAELMVGCACCTLVAAV